MNGPNDSTNDNKDSDSFVGTKTSVGTRSIGTFGSKGPPAHAFATTTTMTSSSSSPSTTNFSPTRFHEEKYYEKEEEKNVLHELKVMGEVVLVAAADVGSDENESFPVNVCTPPSSRRRQQPQQPQQQQQQQHYDDMPAMIDFLLDNNNVINNSINHRNAAAAASTPFMMRQSDADNRCTGTSTSPSPSLEETATQLSNTDVVPVVGTKALWTSSPPLSYSYNQSSDHYYAYPNITHTALVQDDPNPAPDSTPDPFQPKMKNHGEEIMTMHHRMMQYEQQQQQQQQIVPFHSSIRMDGTNNCSSKHNNDVHEIGDCGGGVPSITATATSNTTTTASPSLLMQQPQQQQQQQQQQQELQQQHRNGDSGVLFPSFSWYYYFFSTPIFSTLGFPQSSSARITTTSTALQAQLQQPSSSSSLIAPLLQDCENGTEQQQSTMTNTSGTGIAQQQQYQQYEQSEEGAFTSGWTLMQLLQSLAFIVFSLLCFVTLLKREIRRNSNNNNNDNNNNDNDGYYPQVYRLQRIMECAHQVTTSSILDDPTSPQYKALYWFVLGAGKTLPLLSNDEYNNNNNYNNNDNDIAVFDKRDNDYYYNNNIIDHFFHHHRNHNHHQHQFNESTAQTSAGRDEPICTNTDIMQLYTLIVLSYSIRIPHTEWYPVKDMLNFSEVCHWPRIRCSVLNKTTGVVATSLSSSSSSVPDSTNSIKTSNKKHKHDNNNDQRESYNIIGLSLGNANLTGSLPMTEIFNGLQAIESIELYTNPELVGTIPSISSSSSRSKLSLTNFKIHNTSFYGTVPESLGQYTMLQELFLDHTKLTGTIPQSICDLPNLHHFRYSSSDNTTGTTSSSSSDTYNRSSSSASSSYGNINKSKSNNKGNTNYNNFNYNVDLSSLSELKCLCCP